MVAKRWHLLAVAVTGLSLVFTASTALGQKASMVGELVIPGGPTTWTALLNIAGSPNLIIANDDPAKTAAIYTALQSQLRQGRAPSGAWTGTGGITSSVCYSDSIRMTIGVMTVADFLARNPAPSQKYFFNDQTGTLINLTGHNSWLLLRTTWYGDVNMDGTLASTDYTRMNNAYGNPAYPVQWDNGNMNFDTAFSSLDYTLVNRVWGATTALTKPWTPLPGASGAADPGGGITASTMLTPEPSTLALLVCAGAAGLAIWRKRKLLRSR